MIIILLAVIGAIVSLVFGIKFLIKYKATRKKSHLILGIVLTFVVPAIPAILSFVAFRLYARSDGQFLFLIFK